MKTIKLENYSNDQLIVNVGHLSLRYIRHYIKVIPNLFNALSALDANNVFEMRNDDYSQLLAPECIGKIYDNAKLTFHMRGYWHLLELRSKTNVDRTIEIHLPVNEFVREEYLECLKELKEYRIKQYGRNNGT